jgi:hypothetical protein
MLLGDDPAVDDQKAAGEPVAPSRSKKPPIDNEDVVVLSRKSPARLPVAAFCSATHEARLLEIEDMDADAVLDIVRRTHDRPGCALTILPLTPQAAREVRLPDSRWPSPRLGGEAREGCAAAAATDRRPQRPGDSLKS